MDNITHSLTGVFLSRAGFNRFSPHATVLLLISANIPDSDVISLLGGPLNYFHWHRHITHSLIATPVLALLTVLLSRLFVGPLLWLPAFGIALAGVASHLVLDLTNIYGVRLLLPFSGEWFHWDLTPVIDFWLWGMFLICVAGPFLSRLISSEIGTSARGTYPGRGLAVLALGFLLTYNLGRMVLHTRAVRILESREYEGGTPLRSAAFADSSNPLLWKGVAETERSYEVFHLDLSKTFDPSQGEIARKAQPSRAIDAAQETRPFQILRQFAVYPIYRLVPEMDPEGDASVELSDLRFPFASTAIIDKNFQVRRSSFQFSGASR